MRTLIASLIILSPVLIQAQASKQVEGANLQARKEALKLFMPSTAASVPSTVLTEKPATAQSVRVSTGVASAQIVHNADVKFSAADLRPGDNRVVVSLTVDSQGRPVAPKVVESQNLLLNERVLEAVNQMAFKPAVLDQQKVAEPVKLTFVFQQ